MNVLNCPNAERVVRSIPNAFKRVSVEAKLEPVAKCPEASRLIVREASAL